jgi:hypothetical protein
MMKRTRFTRGREQLFVDSIYCIKVIKIISASPESAARF